MQKLRYKKDFKTGVLLIAVLLLASVALIVFSVVSKIQYDNLVSNMKSVEATIVDIDLYISFRGPDEQEIYITYQVGKVVYSRKLETDTAISFAPGIEANYSVGDKINIFYDPQDPNIIASPRSVTVGYWAMAIGLIFFLLMAIPLISVLKKRREFLVTQEEYENEKRKRKNSELLDKDGEKIRWQHFNVCIYVMLTLFSAVYVMLIMMEFKKGNFDIWNMIIEMSGATSVVLPIYAFFISPFIILSILNRFCFGKVLGVVNDSTLFLNDREININNIIEITYHPRLISRGKDSFCYATFVIQNQKGNTKLLDVVHFPLYGLRKIKKYNRNIKLSCDKHIWFLIFTPTIILAVMGFVLS